MPELRVVLEHITTQDAAEFVASEQAQVAATVTPQHMLLNRNALFLGGLRPHAFCLPVLKREEHRRAVLAAATSGGRRFFLGTDSAPHPRSAKESACGCAGIFSAPVALALYAHAFEQAGALQHFEGFASHNGADWYRLPRNPGELASSGGLSASAEHQAAPAVAGGVGQGACWRGSRGLAPPAAVVSGWCSGQATCPVSCCAGKVVLRRQPWSVPDLYDFGSEVVVPMWAGQQCPWSLAEVLDG